MFLAKAFSTVFVTVDGKINSPIVIPLNSASVVVGKPKIVSGTSNLSKVIGFAE